MNAWAGRSNWGPRRVAAAVWLTTLLACFPCWAQSSPTDAEYQIKAAYIFKFLAFVEWPPASFSSATAPMVIGVLGAPALADELEKIVGSRQANGRTVLIRRLREGDAVGGLHLLFVARPETQRLAGIASAVKERPLLLVTEMIDPAAVVAGINFVVSDDKVRFDIAPAAFERVDLKVSARLLTVARKVLPGVP